MAKTKRTFLTKKDAMSFARYIVSDERRDKLRKEAERKFNAGIKDVTPWSILVRIVTEEDYQYWKTNIQEQ